MLKIKELREARNLTQDEMVTITGIPKRSYINYERNKTDIPLSKLQDIANSLNLSIVDLIAEDSKSKKNLTLLKGKEKGKEKGKIPKVKKTLPFLGHLSLSETGAPYYNKPVSAGALELQYDQLVENEVTGYINIPGVQCKAYFPVVGFSFKPVIQPGDIIGVRDVERWERLDPDCIYFIITHHERMIKHLRDHPTDEDKLICISPNLKEFDLPKEEILEVYKVIFYGRLT